MIPNSSRKRQRPPHHHASAIVEAFPHKTISEFSQKLPRTSFSFNDPSTADVILRFFIDRSPFDSSNPSDSARYSDLQIYLHSRVIFGAKYFSALLSDRWQHQANNHNAGHDSRTIANCNKMFHLNLGVHDDPTVHLTVLQLLYTYDFPTVIASASTALEILPVALELLFEDCVKACVKFLEAVPWSEEEEKRVLSLIPLLREEESKELLARVSPGEDDFYEEMLHGLIEKAIEEKESLVQYSSPDFRGDHNETEAIQRLHLHTAMTNGRHLLWLVERMIELKVADLAVKQWSEQAAFTVDLQKAFRDDAWRNIVPGLPAVMLRCTCKLASAVAAGTILSSRQVRMKLVKDWLPVLISCKDNVSPMLPSHKTLYLELEETFLRIISTLPMSDAQVLLQQCLSFSTRNVEDCPHLVTAFNTWFRRASQPPQMENVG
ncbi:hypothetical protein Goari_005868 [Gossypium aridum]|uniref:At3g05675-like ankyrin-like domain-containing protein n=1 Tax=Gossypium aridum TaxID=34290 RepID=A0A7J8XMW7_GOSAI|nr:hypothetical protein [Gossypium aridum]